MLLIQDREKLVKGMATSCRERLWEDWGFHNSQSEWEAPCM